jgi:hypothetical protein
MLNKSLIPLLTSTILTLSICPVWGQSNTKSKITFACEKSQGIPITVAKNSEGKTQTIFHWQQENLTTIAESPQQLCDGISEKLNNSTAKGADLSSFALIGEQQAGLPVICLVKERDCNSILIGLYPTKTPLYKAYELLGKIIDNEIPPKNLGSEKAPIFAYQVNLSELFANKT